MGANLGMNPSAVFTDRRHLNAQRLTGGTATLARTDQSDQDNFPSSEPVIPAADRFTRTCRRSERGRTYAGGQVLTFLWSRLAGMNNAQKTVNLLERIEFLLEAIAGELKVARMDRGPVPGHVIGMNRYNFVRSGSLTKCPDSKRRESMEE
jgi:hypothetical protein